MTTHVRVSLRGVPEALLVRSVVDIHVPAPAMAADVVAAVAGLDERLREPLLREDGTPRSSSRVLAGDRVLAPTDTVPAGERLRLVSTLPCDG